MEHTDVNLRRPLVWGEKLPTSGNAARPARNMFGVVNHTKILYASQYLGYTH